MDYFRDDGVGSKPQTPKVLFRRPGSRDGSGILPGLDYIRIGNYNRSSNPNVEQPEEIYAPSMKQNNQLMTRSNVDLARIGSRENMGSKALVPLRQTTDLLSREVDKEVNNMQVQSRIRDLESMIIDFKGNIERRIQKIQDEQPGKFMANFKRLEDKEGQMWKDNNLKQGLITDQYQIVKESMRKNNEVNGQTILELQRKIDEVSYQNHKLQKSQEQLQVYIKNGPLAIDNNQKKRYDPQEGQLALLKEQFNQELRIRENAFEDLNRNYQDIQKKVFEQEKEFLVRLQKQRDQIIDETNTHKLQIKQLEGVKMDKLMGENDYLKQLIDQVERRLEDEMDKRLKQEFENKAYLEQKMNLFKDEVRNEEKSILEGEQRFIKQMNDSIQSIHQIIKFTKEEQDANLASTQTLFAENIKNFGQQIDVIKETLETKVMILEKGYKEVNFKVNETKQQFHEHVNTINMQVDRQNQVIDSYEQKISKNIQEIEKELKQKFVDMEKESELWKDRFEKKNLAIFQEISNAMKGLKQDMNLEKKENLLRLKDIKEEMDSYQKMNEKLIQNLKEHTDRIQQSTEYLIQENDKKQQDNLAQAQIELEKMMRQLDETQFERAKEFTIEKIVQLDEKICKELNEVMNNYRIEFNTQLIKLKDNLEGQLQEKEKSLLEKIKNNRLYCDELNDQLLKIIKKDQNDLFEFKQQHLEDLRNLRKEHLDGLKKAMNEMQLEMDSKIDVEHKKWEMALHIQTRQFERQFEELNARFNEHMDKLKEELIERFRHELEEIVMKKIMAEIQQERNERIRRENEIETSMHNIKNMILEALHQKVESAKALARALVNEEAAERAKNDEEILRFMKDSIDTLDRTLRQLIKTSIEECMYILRQEIKKLEDQLNEFKEWTMKELKRIQDEMKEWQNEVRAENYLRDVYQKLRDEEFSQTVKNIEFELISIKKNREEDLLLLIQEINIRQEEIARIDLILEDHENRISQLRNDHDDLRNEFEQHVDWVKQTIQEQRDDFEKFKSITNRNVKFLDEEIKHHYKYFEGRIYLDYMYNRIQVNALMDQSSSNKEKIKKIQEKIKEIILQVNENYQQQENFEEKTEKNFKIAEKAIRSHTQYINLLDARLQMEEIVNRLVQEDLVMQNNQVRKEMKQNLVLLNEEFQKAINEFREDNNKQLEELEKQTMENQNKIDEQEQKLEEQNEQIGNCNKLIAVVETDLKATEQLLNSKIDNDIQGITDNMNQFQSENEQFKDEVNNKFDEANNRVDELNQKVDDQNQKVDEVNQRVDEGNQNQDDLNNKIEEINQKVEEGNQKIDEVNEKIEESNQKIEEANQRIEEANQKIEETDQKFEEVNQKIEEGNQKIEETNEKFEEINQKIEEANQKAEEIGQKTDEAAQKADEAHQRIDELGEKQEDMGSKQQAINKKLDDSIEKDGDSNTKFDDINQKLEEQDEKLNQYEEKINQLEEKVNSLEEQIEPKFEEMSQKQEEMNQQLQEKEKNIEDLAEDIHKQIDRIDQLEEEIQDLKNNSPNQSKDNNKDNKKDKEPKKDSNQNESYDRKINEFDEELNNLKEEFQVLKGEELVQVRNDLEEQIKKLEEQMQDMQNKSRNGSKNNLSRDNEQIEQAKNDIEEVKNELQELKTELQEAKQDSQEAKELVEELKQDNQDMKQEIEDQKTNLQAVGEALEEVKEIDERFRQIESRIAKIESKAK